MKTVISRTHPDIQFVAALHKEKSRTEYKLYIAEGMRVCTTLIQAGNCPTRVYVTESLVAQAQVLVEDKRIIVVTDPVMEKLSTTKTPSGFLAVFPIPEQKSLDQVTSGLVLASISDPGNMGTLIRSSAAMGCSTVVVVEGTDVWAPKVVQASAGTIGTINIIQTTWQELVKHKGAYKLSAMVVKGGQSPDKIDFANTLLVVGNEAHGLPDAWINECDSLVTLPMPGNTESLNAAVAGSIALYLAFGQRSS